MLHWIQSLRAQDQPPAPAAPKPPRKLRRILRGAAIVLGGVIVLMVAIQLLYPAERTLPLTKVADIGIGGMNKRDAIDRLFATYGSAELSVSVAGKTIKTTTDKVGVLVDFQKAADAAARYPWWQRLVPFSLFYKSLVINASPEITVDDQLAKQFTKKVGETCDKAAKEASVSIKDGKVALQPGEDGRKCTEKAVRDGLAGALLRHGSAQIVIRGEKVAPTKTTAVAQAQVDQAEAVIASGLAIVVGDQRTTVDKETLASWIKFADDPAKGTFTVAFDDAAIKKYLESLRQPVYAAPVATSIYLLDGDETRREAGQAGRDIDYDATAASVTQALQGKRTKSVAAKTRTLAAGTNYVRDYSQTQRGLEVLLADIAARKGNYGIVVTELGGLQRSASANGGRKYVTASTYKLFVAYMVLKDLESGGLRWEDTIVDGLNVRQCFEEMIVRSANRCAVAYINRYGGTNIVAKMRELGFASVERNSTWWATTNDLASYMTRLERGELLQGESRNFLLGLLKRQIWRYGIPTGIKGVTVADKVGFLEDYIHDVAIVYGPKGTYVLAIMTKGGSYAGMADVARQVHAYMSR